MTAAESTPKLNELQPLAPVNPKASTNTGKRINKPLKIALLGYRSAPHVGGQGIYLKYLSSALANLGHQVHVYSGPPYPELAAPVELFKVPSLDLYAAENHVTALKPKHLRSFTDTWEWWTMLTGGFGEPYTFGRRIAKQLANSDYDIIHDNQCLAHGLIHLQNRGHTVVSTIHHPIHRDRETALAAAPDWQHRLLVKRWYSFLNMQQKVVDQLAHVTTVSQTSAKDISAFFGRSENIRIIANGIDTQIFKPLAVNKKPFRIITTASSDQPLKGLTYLLDAFSLIVKSNAKAELRIIGKLKKGGAAEKRIQKYGLEKHVSFRSNLSTQKLVEEYNRAAVAVCPSLYEGFGLPAGEAMACGLPVVSSDGGALPEVVGDAGLIVPAGNAEQLASALLKIFREPELAQELVNKARARIESTFCWNKVAEKMTEYYRDIIATKNKAQKYRRHANA